MEYHTGAPAEVFTCDVELLPSRRKFCNKTFHELKPILRKHCGKTPTCIPSWKTGAKKERLSSQIVATEFVAPDCPWEDALPNAVFENATTVEEIFDSNYPPETVEEAFILVKSRIDENIIAEGVVLLDRNKTHFSGQHDLKKVLVEKGYKLVADIFGAVSAEILLYEHSDENFLVFLHAPYGIAMDARFFILVEESIHHILTMEILCQCVLFLDGEEITSTANASTDNDCITGSFLFEAVNRIEGKSGYLKSRNFNYF